MALPQSRRLTENEPPASQPPGLARQGNLVAPVLMNQAFLEDDAGLQGRDKEASWNTVIPNRVCPGPESERPAPSPLGRRDASPCVNASSPP